MITDSFDDRTEAVFTPEAFLGERKKVSDIAIITFSREIYAEVLKTIPNRKIDELKAANRIRPVHLLTAGDLECVFYLSEIGSAQAANDVMEVNWQTGADKFIMFGSAGSLDAELTSGKYIVPTAAYRDEGTSYHFAPPADYIDVRNADFVTDFFARNSIPFVNGKVWTTDVFYRETRGLVKARKEEGCIAVDMEVAGVQSVCDYYGWQLYNFLASGDVVDQAEYTSDGLHEANHSLDKFNIALKMAGEMLAPDR